jgi:drug/metabolite transporter (DMT)-like permease
MTGGKTEALRMGASEWILLIALATVWGGSFFFAAVALETLPPFTIVFARVAIAAVALNILVRALGLRLPLTRADSLRFLAMGALNNAIPFSLTVWGQTQIVSGLAAILNATTPLFTVLLAHFLTRDERLTPARGAGVAVGFVGAVIVIGPAALTGFGNGAWAEIGVLAAALSYAAAGIYGRRFRAVPPVVTATGQVTASSLMILPMMLIVDAPWSLPMPDLKAIGALLGIGLLCTAAAYLMFFRILAAAGAINLLLVTFLIPVSALALGIAFLGEALTLRQALGMALIGVGLAAIDGRVVRLVRRGQPRRGSSDDSPPASADHRSR